MRTLLEPHDAVWAGHTDAEFYFGPADFLAQFPEIEILPRNAGFRRLRRPFG
jgi:hypothetical protein